MPSLIKVIVAAVLIVLFYTAWLRAASEPEEWYPELAVADAVEEN